MRHILLTLSAIIVSALLFQARAAFPIDYRVQEESPTTAGASFNKQTASCQKPVSLTEWGATSVKYKSRTSAALYAFFLGRFGIHRFYLGYDWQGILQALSYPLLIGGIILSSGAALFGPAAIIVPVILIGGAIAIWVWSFIDFIRILANDLTPVNGNYAH